MADQASPRTAPARILALDVLRGLALVAMVVFHFGWDLSFLGLGALGLADSLAWSAFGHAIAAVFLTLVGISLVLAHGGQDTGVDSLKFLKRLGVVALAALAVSLGTYVAMPGQFIYFGILHAIALGSLLALPFLRAPLLVVVVAAGLVLVLPVLVKGAVFSTLWLVWLGLGPEAPPSTDYVPVFPWFGFILIGILLARALDLHRLGSLGAERVPGRILAFAGRHSLAVYLLHQPILYGGLWLLAQAVAPPVERDRADFMSACTRECGANGGDALRCATICACAVENLKAEKLWSDVIANRVTDTLKTRMGEISRACAAKL